MKYTDNAINILTAKTYKGIGKAWIVQNIHHNEDVATIVQRLNTKLVEPTSIADFERIKNSILLHIENIRSYVDGITAIGDEDFPYVRGTVKDGEQPIVLYYKGDISLLHKNNHNVAVIGLLNPDLTTVEEETSVVTKLVNAGWCIVSGLAVGCDSVAHQTTLDNHGKTIAVLPSSLKTILPTQNKNLAEQIVHDGGLLITEYGKDAISDMELRGRYQERDRLQALFSDSIILSASYAKNNLGNDSGSRLAMEYARNYKIPRFVLYQENRDKDNPKYDLTRQVLAEGDTTILDVNNAATIIENKRLSSQIPVQTQLF